MAAFSWGFTAFARGRPCFQLPPSLPIPALQCRTQSLRCSKTIRFFSGSTWQNAKAAKLSKAATAQKIPIPRSSPRPALTKAPSSGPAAFIGQPVHKVALLEEPTLLYKAPSQRAFIFVSWGWAATFLTCGLYLYTNVYPEIKGQHWFAGPAYGGMLIVFTALATNYVLASRALVKSIKAIPVERNRQRSLNLRFEIRRFIPFAPRQMLEVPVAHVSKPAADIFKHLAMDTALTKELLRRSKLGPGNEPLFIRPFTRLGRFVSRNAWRFWQYNRAIAGGQGIALLYVKERTFTLRVDGSGWFLDDGKGTLLRTVRVSRLTGGLTALDHIVSVAR